MSEETKVETPIVAPVPPVVKVTPAVAPVVKVVKKPSSLAEKQAALKGVK